MRKISGILKSFIYVHILETFLFIFEKKIDFLNKK
nr:MAG TPA: hypothetical protein [Caudoviricetes sp.]